jgi:hypothetical protein
MQEFDKYLGLALISTVLVILWKNPSGTAQIFTALGNLNVQTLNALQGNAAGLRIA